MATRACRHRPTRLVWDPADDAHARRVGFAPGWYLDYDRWWQRRPCEYGNCALFSCPECASIQARMEHEGCPCEAYPPRPGQRPRPRVFGLKPSVARRRRGRHRARSRR